METSSRFTGQLPVVQCRSQSIIGKSRLGCLWCTQPAGIEVVSE